MQPSSDPATETVLCGLSSCSVTAGQEQAHPQLCHTRTLIKRCFKSWPCHCTAACCASHSLCSSTCSLKEQRTSHCSIVDLVKEKEQNPSQALKPTTSSHSKAEISVLLQFLGREESALCEADPEGRYHTSEAESSHPHHSHHNWCSSDLSDTENKWLPRPHGVLWAASALLLLSCCKSDRERGLQLN